MDPEIFWFVFYGHLKVRKFRKFEDFWKLTIFNFFAKSANFLFSKMCCFAMNFKTSSTSCREKLNRFSAQKVYFLRNQFHRWWKNPEKADFCHLFFSNGQKRQWKVKMWWSFIFLFNSTIQKVGQNRWKSSYFPISWDFGSFYMRAFVKIRDYIIPRGKIL